MRVALLRGSLLRASEMPNFEIPDVHVEAFASRAVGKRLDQQSLTVHGLPSSGDLLGHLPPRVAAVIDLLAGSTELLWGVRRALRGFDVAHALELENPLTWQALGARDSGACRAVVATVMENIPFRRVPNAAVARRVERVAREVDRFLPVTERAALHLETAGVPADRITVVPEGIDIEQFSPGPETGRAPDAPLRVISVTRLERAKGVEDLVIAVGLLKRRGVDVHVTLCGSGPLARHLEDLATDMGVDDRVRFSGQTLWPELPAEYRAHDVFVLASAPTSNWREQFGFAVVEAMACGLPVLVGGSGSLPEVVGRDDVLVRPHDPLHLADRLQALAADEAARRELGAAMRRRAVERFDVRDVRRRLREIYEDVLARTARQP